MKKVILMAGLFSPFLVNALALRVVANPELPTANQLTEANAFAQVTSVSQLSDVRPTDWAFQALQSLVERYGTNSRQD
jgi:hypothetical protein